MRGVSTILDVTLFLLLVGGGVLLLSAPTGTLPTPDEDAADGTAELLATSTADVRYSLAPGARRADGSLVAFPHADGPAFRRTAHGTLAAHLAAGARRNVTVDDRQVTHEAVDYRRATTGAVENATRGRETLAHVRAVWEPYPGAPVEGSVVAGPRPPPGADVHVATLTVDSGYPAAAADARRAAAEDGFSGVARVVAVRTVDGYFPPAHTRDLLLEDYPVDRLTAYRYRRFGRLVGANVTDHVGTEATAAANDELAATLTDRMAADMRRRFDTPAAAARAVSVDTVEITVRTWSP